MSPFKVLLTDGLEEDGQAILKQNCDVTDSTGISADELLKVIGEYDAMVVRSRTKVTPAVFDAGKKLKVVGRAGVGVDNIDLNAAKEHGVTVINAPVATTITVAELTVGLMMSLAREIARADNGIKNGKWLKKEMEGVELYQKTLGIIGFGRIGSCVATRVAGFGMNLIAYDPIKSEEDMREKGVKKVSLDELFANADIITIHVPLNASTRGMISREAIAKMKDGVRIICSARGGIIDEEALLANLESGKVAGAGLDVFGTEPPGQSPLAIHPRVVATPHIGAQTGEAQRRAAIDISNETLAALRQEPLRWKVA